MDTNTKKELEFLFKPLTILVSIIALLFVVLTFGIKQINLVRTKIASIKSTEEVLSKKVLALETVSKVLSGNSTFLDIVLPSKGSVLYGLSQIKAQAVQYNLNLSGLKTGSSVPEKEGVFKTSISFDIEGEEQSIYLFLNSFSKLLPLMNVDKVSLSKSADVLSANVTASVFSSEFPKKIPAVTDPIKELSNEDIKLLNELANYTLPQFVEPGVENSNSTKTDPFN